MRWKTLQFALLWYGGWFGKRLLRRSGFPRGLVLAEAIGALRGPLAYWQAVRQARRIAQQYEQQQAVATVQRVPELRTTPGESA